MAFNTFHDLKNVKIYLMWVTNEVNDCQMTYYRCSSHDSKKI